MPWPEPAHGAHHRFGGYVVDDVGEKYDERTLAQTLREIAVGRFKVGLDDLGVNVVGRSDHSLGRASPALWRQVGAHAAVESEKADLVSCARRYVGQHQHGIERVIELRKAECLGRHEPATVEHAKNLS